MNIDESNPAKKVNQNERETLSPEDIEGKRKENHENAVKQLYRTGRHPLLILFAIVFTAYLIVSMVIYRNGSDEILFLLKIPYAVICLGLWITILLMFLEKKSTLSFRLIRLFLLIPEIAALMIPLLAIGYCLGEIAVQETYTNTQLLQVIFSILFLDLVFAFWHGLRSIPRDAVLILKGKKNVIRGGLYPAFILLLMAAVRLAATFKAELVSEKFAAASTSIMEFLNEKIVTSSTDTFVSNVSTFLVNTTEEILEHTNNALTVMAGADAMHILLAILCAAVYLSGALMLVKIHITQWES